MHTINLYYDRQTSRQTERDVWGECCKARNGNGIEWNEAALSVAQWQKWIKTQQIAKMN